MEFDLFLDCFRYPVTIQRLLSEVLSLHDMFSQALVEEDKVRDMYCFSFAVTRVNLIHF